MCTEIVNLIANCVSAVGTLLMGIGAVLNLPRLFRYTFTNDECFFGDEAKERYEKIKDTLPTKYPFVWGPTEWGGGKDISYMFEVKKVFYDPKTMGSEWKGCKKSIRYVYPENEKLMVMGWRLK
ncbi:hypothetical protein AGMMS50212_03630 [Spirochaetia bacterium]|nr:hypothetical protein AGMMS50212_03630 [Spirochaetia bacterium]